MQFFTQVAIVSKIACSIFWRLRKDRKKILLNQIPILVRILVRHAIALHVIKSFKHYRDMLFISSQPRTEQKEKIGLPWKSL